MAVRTERAVQVQGRHRAVRPPKRHRHPASAPAKAPAQATPPAPSTARREAAASSLCCCLAGQRVAACSGKRVALVHTSACAPRRGGRWALLPTHPAAPRCAFAWTRGAAYMGNLHGRPSRKLNAMCHRLRRIACRTRGLARPDVTAAGARAAPRPPQAGRNAQGGQGRHPDIGARQWGLSAGSGQAGFDAGVSPIFNIIDQSIRSEDPPGHPQHATQQGSGHTAGPHRRWRPPDCRPSLLRRARALRQHGARRLATAAAAASALAAPPAARPRPGRASGGPSGRAQGGRTRLGGGGGRPAPEPGLCPRRGCLGAAQRQRQRGAGRRGRAGRRAGHAAGGGAGGRPAVRVRSFPHIRT
jgi:hypothetical protein